MTNLLRDDEGEIRLMGSQAFIGAAIQRIGTAVDVSYDGNLRANRSGDGHRAHAHIRLAGPAAPVAIDTPSPREAAEQAKARRDLGGEIDALSAADRELRTQPWFPIRPGDVVCWSVDMPDGDRHGETLIAVDAPDWSTEAGAPLRKVSQTPYETIGAATDDSAEQVEEDQANEQYEDFYDIWFEAGPAKIAVLRHGQLVHGTVPAAPEPAHT